MTVKHNHLRLKKKCQDLIGVILIYNVTRFHNKTTLLFHKILKIQVIITKASTQLGYFFFLLDFLLFPIQDLVKLCICC